jgi:mRNA interferase MazF
MRRGDVVWVDLDPTRGAEAARRRPAVIVSNDGANRATQRHARGVVTVVPVTSNTSRVYAFQVLLPAERCRLPRDGKAQAEQIRSIAFERVGDRVGRVPPDLLDDLDRAIRLHLGL